MQEDKNHKKTVEKRIRGDGSALFVFGYMIGALIHFFRNFSELSFFPYFFKMSGVFFSGGIFAAMHFNVVGAKKQLESKDSLDDE